MAVPLLLVACGGAVEETREFGIAGFLEIRPIVQGGCPDCRVFELVKNSGRLQPAVASQFLRLGASDVKRIELNGETGVPESEQELVVGVWPTSHGRARLRPFLDLLPEGTELLILAGDDVPLAVISADLLSEKEGFFAFVMPAQGTVEKFRERVRPTSSRTKYHPPVDPEVACETVANGDRELAEICLEEYRRRQ